MSDEIEFPLFPLNVVMFPKSKIPLHIFEERYKTMIELCITDGAEFGINLFSKRKIYDVGCTSVVSAVTKKFDSGEMDIIVKGVSRYRIIKYRLGKDGFFIGTVEMIENDFSKDKSQMIKAAELYNDFVEIVYKGSVKKVDLNDQKWQDESAMLSYLIAEKSGLNLEERQLLLEMDTETERLDFIMKYFEEVFPKLKNAEKISNIIKSDGYLQ